MNIKFLKFYPALFLAGYWIVTKISLPFVEQIAHTLGTNISNIQRVISLSIAVSGVSVIFFSRIIERLGYKLSIGLVICLSIIFLSGIVFYDSFISFIICYLTAVTLLFCLLFLSRSFPQVYIINPDEKIKAYSYQNKSAYICSFSVPIVSGFVGSKDWHYSYILAIVYLIILFYLSILLPKVEIMADVKKSIITFRSIIKTIRIEGFLSNVFLLQLINCAGWSYLVSLTFWLSEKYHISPTVLGFYLMPAAITGLCGDILVTKFVAKYLGTDGAIKVMIGSVAFASIICLLISFNLTSSSIYYILPGVFYALASSYTYGHLLAMSYKNVDSIYLNEASALSTLVAYVLLGLLIYIQSLISVHKFYLQGFLSLALAFVSLIIFYTRKSTKKKYV